MTRHIVMAGHSAFVRAFTPVFDGLWTRVFDALCAGMTVQDAMPSSHPRRRGRRPLGGRPFTYSLVKQPSRCATSSPGLVRAPGSARSPLPFLLPQCEGVARQGRRATDFAVAARVLPGDLAQEA